MEITFLQETADSLNTLGAFAVGHVNLKDFADEIASSCDIKFNPDNCKHGYGRKIPTRDNLGYWFTYSKIQTGMGSFPCTYIDLTLGVGD